MKHKFTFLLLVLFIWTKFESATQYLLDIIVRQLVYQKCIFSGLIPNSIYYFKICNYTESALSIDNKLDEAISQVSKSSN